MIYQKESPNNTVQVKITKDEKPKTRTVQVETTIESEE